MASDYEVFWAKRSYAVVGHAARKNFPHLTYQGLKKRGKVVFPVDPSVDEIEGDRVYADLEALPSKSSVTIQQRGKRHKVQLCIRTDQQRIHSFQVRRKRFQ